MNVERQKFFSDENSLKDGELSAASLLASLEAHRQKTLVFHYDGRDIQAGYHVTEVKTGIFQALDCGANYETWPETFIQLWDIPQEEDRPFMPVGKFLAIIGKVAKEIPFDPAAKLTFEVSDGHRAMQIYRAASFAVLDDVVRVGLTQRPASCKPRDRWLEQNAASCGCAPRETKSACCQ